MVLGFEAQRHKEELQTLQKERYKIKTATHEVDLFIKDTNAQMEYGKYFSNILTARRVDPAMAADLEAELAKVSAERKAAAQAA